MQKQCTNSIFALSDQFLIFFGETGLLDQELHELGQTSFIVRKIIQTCAKYIIQGSMGKGIYHFLYLCFEADRGHALLFPLAHTHARTHIKLKIFIQEDKKTKTKKQIHSMKDSTFSQQTRSIMNGITSH